MRRPTIMEVAMTAGVVAFVWALARPVSIEPGSPRPGPPRQPWGSGSGDTSRENLERLVEGGSDAWTWLMLARRRRIDGDLEGFAQAVAKATELSEMSNPSDNSYHRLMYTLGWARRLLGDTAGSARAFTAAAARYRTMMTDSRFRDRAEFWRRAGWSFQLSGSTAEALHAWEKARDLLTRVAESPDYPPSATTLYDLACMRALTGSAEGAIEALNAAVRAGYTDAGWAAQDEDLESLRGLEDFESLLELMRQREEMAASPQTP